MTACRQHRLVEARTLVGPHRRHPREAQAASAYLFGQSGHPAAMCEKRLVLEADVGERVPFPEMFELVANPARLETEPRAAVHRWIGAEGAAEAASLRRDVVQLPLALQREIVIHVDQAIVVCGERVDVARRTRRGGRGPP